jgi:hypothetical protein
MHRSLLAEGVVVLEDARITKKMEYYRRRFDSTLDSFPEFARPLENNARYVRGGFAALANPGSFHAPFIRELRAVCMSALMPLFSAVCREGPSVFKNANVACMMDRMLFRRAGDVATPEYWHRDLSPTMPDGVLAVFGGWINLDSEPQYFSCVPGTHSIITATSRHFTLSSSSSSGAGDSIGGKSAKKQRFDPYGFATVKDAEEKKRLKKESVTFTISPGGIVVFFESILHEVVARARAHDMRRLFLAHFLSEFSEVHYPADLPLCLENQATPRLKSNQRPAMYPQADYMFRHHDLQKWSLATMDPRTIDNDVRRRNMRENTTEILSIVHREPRSLRDCGLPMYPAYTEREQEIFFARRRHVLPDLNDTSRWIEMSL